MLNIKGLSNPARRPYAFFVTHTQVGSKVWNNSDFLEIENVSNFKNTLRTVVF